MQILSKILNQLTEITPLQTYHLHEMFFCAYVKTSVPCNRLPIEPYIYRGGGEGGTDVAKHFINFLIRISESIKLLTHGRGRTGVTYVIVSLKMTKSEITVI